MQGMIGVVQTEVVADPVAEMLDHTLAIPVRLPRHRLAIPQ